VPEGLPEEQFRYQPEGLDHPKLLIGEGKEEVMFFNALLNHLKITDVKVEEYGGKGKLSDYLKTLVVRPGYANLITVGITRDADGSATDAFKSVTNFLGLTGLISPARSGLRANGIPNVGIFIFPDGEHSGMLEDLALEALQGDPVLRCVEEFLACASDVSANIKEVSKAKIHAWLATRNPPDLRLGIAAQKGLIDWQHPSFLSLTNFLQAL
jgi:hypothetical protein